jgi:hypothetical protein
MGVAVISQEEEDFNWNCVLQEHRMAHVIQNSIPPSSANHSHFISIVTSHQQFLEH